MLIAKIPELNLYKRFAPAYTHIVFGKEEDCVDEEKAYFTRTAWNKPNCGGRVESNGHYNMNIIEAAEDFRDRLERGY